MTKTVAERLREIKGASLPCRGDILASALGRKLDCPIGEDCINCIGRLASELADTIEAEQTQAVSKALKGAKPQLPEGVIWPTYEDGELVKFGEEFIAPEYGENKPQKLTRLVLYAEEHFPDGTEGALWDANYLRPGGAIGKDYRLKRPEPEVLDADGVPIKVGDTVWWTSFDGEMMERTVESFSRPCGHSEIRVHFTNKSWMPHNELTHRKPDTQEAINHDAALLVSESFFDQRRDEFEDRVFDLLKRQRKLLGGE